MTTKIKRFNWRVKEKTAAELSFAYRNGGFRSWDEFMRKLLDLWNHKPEQPTDTAIEREIRSVKRDLQTLTSQTGHFHLLMDGQVEALHALHLGQEQLYAVVNRLNGLLQMAFELAGDKPSTPKPDDKDLSPEEEAIRKIRNRNLE